MGKLGLKNENEIPDAAKDCAFKGDGIVPTIFLRCSASPYRS